MTYGDIKDLPRTTATNKVLWIKHLVLQKLKCNGHKGVITSLVCKFFDKNSSGKGVKSKIMPNQELAEELQNLIIRKFKKRQVLLIF